MEVEENDTEIKFGDKIKNIAKNATI